jgi:aminobenzoyl-glutamate utilization protein A
MTPPRSEGFVHMPDVEFEASLTRAAEEGAKRALADAGLDGDEAALAWAQDVNAAMRAFATVLPDLFFGASEDAGTLSRRVAERGGQGGAFVLGADLADDHHTPNLDFDEAALAKSALLSSGLLAAAMGSD